MSKRKRLDLGVAPPLPKKKIKENKKTRLGSGLPPKKRKKRKKKKEEERFALLLMC
jgi:hypothetical protein